MHARRDGMVLVPAAKVELASFPSAARTGLVEVAAFQLDEAEVTVAAFSACVRAGMCAKPGPPTESKKASARAQEPLCNWRKPGREAHPMNCVRQAEAKAFCEWKHKRLPTEEEWQAAAEGGERRAYPWGTELPADRACWDGAGSNVGAGKRANTCAARSFPSGKSAQGAFDLAGNVWEWTSSCLDGGCTEVSVRGGAWFNESASSLTASVRQGEVATVSSPGLGFRCARGNE
jgi:serine/threonine-protein kinase